MRYLDLRNSTDSNSPSKLAMLVGEETGVLFLTGEDSLSLRSAAVDMLLPDANVKSRVSSTK
jgi:hypothetical protein